MTAIDWSRIRSVDDVITPAPFQLDADTGACPTGTERLFHVEHGSRVVDAAGNRFLVMGYGSVQGTVILRDRYRRMFHADGSMVLRPVEYAAPAWIADMPDGEPRAFLTRAAARASGARDGEMRRTTIADLYADLYDAPAKLTPPAIVAAWNAGTAIWSADA